MSDTKQDVLDMLRELTTLTLLDEGDPQSFRVRAYENATRAIAEQASDLGRLSAQDLRKIQGVGKGIADKVIELLRTGRVEKLEALRRSYPRSLVALLRVQGLGPKAIQKLKNELNVLGIDDLRRVLSEKKLRHVKGFGAKSEAKLAEALARLEAQGSLERWPIAVALPYAERIVTELSTLPGVSHAEYCGSLRRFHETAGDIDIVAVASDARPVMDAFTRLPIVERVLARGEAKTSIVTLRGIQVDLRVVHAEQLGAALLYFTGGKAHNIKLRQRAQARGLILNEYGLFEQGASTPLASTTEAEVYAALGLPFIPPWLREDNGEVEAAEAGGLPRPLGQIHGDFHVHSSLSGDGRSTLDEMIQAARQRGYTTLAVTDHAEGTLSGVSREALLEQRARIAELQRELGQELTLLHGVELNIGRDGELDYDAEFRRSFDWCVASVHAHFELDGAAQTRRITRAMREPEVRMIGHPAARVIGSRAPIAFDTTELLRVAAETGTLLEVNGALPRLDCSADVLRQARGGPARFVLTSDAHHTSELGLMSFAVRNAERGWLEAGQVVNAWPAEELRRWALGPKRLE